MRGLWCVPLLLGGAQAQDTEYERLIDALGSVTGSRVLVFAPSIFDVPLAESLRQSALDSVRRPQIRIVTIQYYNFLPGSTALSLALANVPLYEVQSRPGDGIVVIADRGWKGANLGKRQGAAVTPMTPSEVNRAVRWFHTVTARSRRVTQPEAYRRIKQVLK